MPADTFSTDGVGLMLMGTGNDNNIWGTNQNSNVFQITADALCNLLTETVTGGTLDLSGSPPPATSSQTHHAGILVNGTLASNQTIIVPNLNKWWWISNQTAGAFTLKFKTPSGAVSTPIPQNGGWQVVQCDANNNIIVWAGNTKQLQGPDGNASAPYFSNVNEPNSGWYRFGTQDWRLSINGLDVLQVTGAGAGTPSVVNALSPNVVQQNGVPIVPPGVEVPYAGIVAPAGWYLEFGQAVSRTTDVNLFNAITLTCTGNTHGNTTIDGLSQDLRGLGLIGAFIEATGIAAGTTITAIASATSLTVSASVVGSASLTLRILPYGQGDYNGTVGTTFNVPNRKGVVIAGRSDMGGTDVANLSSINGSRLNGTGGAQTHTLTATEQASMGVSGTCSASGSASGSCSVSGAYSAQVTLAGGGGAFAYAASVGAGGNTGYTDSGSFSGTASVSGSISGTATGGGQAHNILQPTGISNHIIKR
jgi:hypothetical protein